MIFLLSIVIGIVAVIIYQITPNVLEPTHWDNPLPLMSFEGPTAQNNVLTHAYQVSQNFHGPESMAFDDWDGTVYVGFGDGTVRTFSSEGIMQNIIFFAGGYLRHGVEGGEDRTQDLLDWCVKESKEGRLAWNHEGEKKCGRPLGIRTKKDINRVTRVYVLDAYHGLFEIVRQAGIDVDLFHRITPSTIITTPEGADPKTKLTPTFFNDLDISSDGSIVFTDSSYRYSRSQNRPEIMDGAPRGRLLMWQPSRPDELQVLLCGLHFPNGVQFLSPKLLGEERAHKQNEVIVNELTRFRVLRVNIEQAMSRNAELTRSCSEDGSLKQALSRDSYEDSGVGLFISNVPGLVDNVRVVQTPSHGVRYFFGLGSKATAPFSLLHVLLQSNLLRELVGRFLPMKLAEKLVPRYGLVLVSDEQGNFIDSLHDPTGRISMISQASRHPVTGDLWIGSHSEPLSILPAKYLPE